MSQTEQAIWTNIIHRGTVSHRYLRNVLEACGEAAHLLVSSYRNRSSFVDAWYALDGKCINFRGGPYSSWFVTGIRLQRYVFYRLNVEQPPSQDGEDRIPTLSELEAEIASMKAIAASPVERMPGQRRRKAPRSTESRLLSRLQQAITNHRVEVVARLLPKLDAAALNRPNRFGETPLCWAIDAGSTECTRLLLQHGADPNQQIGRYPRYSYSYPLNLAIARKDAAIAQLLLEADEDCRGTLE
jgi:hypothetical protein